MCLLTSPSGCLPATLVSPTSGVPIRLQAVLEDFLEDLYADVLGYAGACMIRRLVGMAHVADMDSIADPDRRCAII